jgi:serine/threonine protein kinase
MRLAHVHAIVKWLEDYEKVRVLGVGGTGIVYELLHKSNGSRYAMKEMEIKSSAQMKMAIGEAEMLKDIMENISHPRVMHIEKLFQVGSKFYLVFPLCLGGELYEHVIRRGHFTEHDAASLMIDLISGLHALHEHDILHLDIKPENILFDSMDEDAKIMITDFGLSRIFSEMKGEQQALPNAEQMEKKLKAFSESGVLDRDRLRGTIGYMSPELILAGCCCKATDVFAAGVVLYILLCGRPPFQSKSNREILEKSARGVYRIDGPDWEDVSEDAKDLVKKMLIVDPNSRITTEEILAHPWLQIEIDEVEDIVNDELPTISNPKGIDVAKRTFTGPKKQSSVNLSNALRRLSGHVNERKASKLAMTFTRLVSSIQSGAIGRSSTLISELIVPIGSSGADAVTSSLLCTAEDMLVYMDPSIKDALTNVFLEYGEESGKLSIQQFICVVKHLMGPIISKNESVNSTSSSDNLASLSEANSPTKSPSAPMQRVRSVTTGAANINNPNSDRTSSPTNNLSNLGAPGLIFCQFIDRDGDGFITAEDLFTAQALIMQKSEIFVKTVFRMYSEAVWYPGRQLNHLNLQRATIQANKNRPVSVDGRRSSVIDEHTSKNVVEPPKYITGKHVGVIFERLGFDPTGGQKIFGALCKSLSKTGKEPQEIVHDEIGDQNIKKSNESRNSNLAAVFGIDEDDLAKSFNNKINIDDESTSNLPSTPVRSSFTSTSALNKDNNDNSTSSPDLLIDSVVPNPLARMDVNDFIRALEIDDVLIQIILHKPRGRLLQILEQSEMNNQTDKNELGCIDEDDEDRSSEFEHNNNNTNNLPQPPGSSNSPTRKQKIEKPSFHKLLEEELIEALKDFKPLEKPSFPIANAIRNSTASALLGLATKTFTGAQLIVEATKEISDGGDTDTDRY